MTAVISWSTFCGHGIASLYLATDSRTSLLYPDGSTSIDRDDFQKTFASSRSPDILAVCGRVAGIDKLIPSFFQAAFEDRASVSGSAVADEYSQRVVKQLQDPAMFTGLTLFHGFRFNINEFGLNRIELGRQPTFTKIVLLPRNGLLFRDGSGQEMVQRAQLNDPETDAKGFSRWYWQSFVYSLNPALDKTCGGAPQLVGLFQKGAGIAFGVRFQGETYLNGRRMSDEIAVDVRDELFQRVRADGKLLNGAQPHARNFPKNRLFV